MSKQVQGRQQKKIRKQTGRCRSVMPTYPDRFLLQLTTDTAAHLIINHRCPHKSNTIAASVSLLLCFVFLNFHEIHSGCISRQIYILYTPGLFSLSLRQQRPIPLRKYTHSAFSIIGYRHFLIFLS